jgi:hypothetical protein
MSKYVITQSKLPFALSWKVTFRVGGHGKYPFALSWKVAAQTFSKQGDPCCPPEKADTPEEDNRVG